MKVDECTIDVRASVGGDNLPRVGLTSSALPEAQSSARAESSQTGVSTRNVPLLKDVKTIKDSKKASHWYALRTTYGREKKAYDYLIAKGVTAFYPTKTEVKLVEDKRTIVTSSRIPNIFFAYGTEDVINSFVYDNVNLPFLRFYYMHIHNGKRIEKCPLIVPDTQMESLKIICSREEEDIISMIEEIPKFKVGQSVRVIGGSFEGVQGKVARWKGQQRVAVMIEGLVTMVTAYIPSGYLAYV